MLRTAGGHRRIPRESLAEILSKGGDLGSLINPATAPPSVSSTDTFQSGHSDGDRKAVSDSFVAGLQEEFRQALNAGTENRCRQMIHQLIDLGWSRFQAADALITDAMHHIGHAWAEGEFAIYQERRACSVCQGLLHELRQSIPLAASAPVAIGCSPEGDGYQLPTQMVELALRETGWRATSLGSNVPMSSLMAATNEYKPRLLWVSLSHVESEPQFVAEFNALASSLSRETSIILGGRAATDGLRPKLHYTAHCDSLSHLAVLAAAFLAKLS